MAEKFDPSLSQRYYEWLSIAPEDQPPTLYRLLGLRTFEDDPTVIENAADRQMSHLRTFQSGKHSAESQKILNHVASARVTLLNPEKREEYDKLLREQMKLEAEGSVLDDESSARQEELSTTLVGFLEAIEISKLKEIAEETKKKPKPAEPRKPPKRTAVSSDKAAGDRRLMIGGAIGAGVLLLLVIAVLAVKFGGGKKEERPQKEDAWLADIGQQREPSTPAKPTEPPVKPTEPTTPRPATVPDDQSAEQPVSVQVAEYAKKLTIDLPGDVKMEFVLIPAGEFMMGSSEAQRQLALAEAERRKDGWLKGRIGLEGPQHKVKISQPFYLGKYEVTQAQWQAVMGNNPSKSKGSTNPVEQVSWEDIQQFLAKLNVAFEKKGMVFGLPTEAEWEYACRAGTTTAFSFADDPTLLSQYGWFTGNSGKKTHPVGQGKPNAWGLYDMHGNVWEWCSDWLNWYGKSPRVDPAGPPGGLQRGQRGGSCNCSAMACRTAFRISGGLGARGRDLGFRLALAIPAGEVTETVVEDSKPSVPKSTPEPPEPDAVAVAAPEPPAPKNPVPAPDAQAEMLKQLDEIYEFSERRTPAERLKLARELFELGKESQGEPVEKFVLFRKAMESAQSGGDAGLMLEVVDAICAEFQVDVLEGKQNALAGFVRGSPEPEQIELFIEAGDPVIDDAIAAGRYDIAGNIAEAAYRLAQKSGDRDSRKRAYDRRNAVRKLALKWKELQDVWNTLKTNPDDPAANLAVGQWLCFERQNWKQGLPHLAKCSSPALKGIAAQEVNSPPTTPDAQVKLADAWWNLAEKIEGKEKDALMAHAGEWYGKALDDLPEGFVKAKVRKKLEEVGAVVKIERPMVKKPELPSRTKSTPAPTTASKKSFKVQFSSPTDMKRFVLRKGSQVGVSNGLLGIKGGCVTFGTYFKSISSATIIGGIVPPAKENFRASVGPVNMILNWEGAKKNENHFRYCTDRSPRNRSHATRPYALTPGRFHAIQVRQEGKRIFVLIDGMAHFQTEGKLEGTVSIYPAGSQIVVKEIVIEGEPDLSREVTGPSLGNLY